MEKEEDLAVLVTPREWKPTSRSRSRRRPTNARNTRRTETHMSNPGVVRIIEVERAGEEVEETYIQISRQAGDQKNPISVELYDCEVLIRCAIRSDVINLDDFEEVEEDRKGKKPLSRSLKRPFIDLSAIDIGESSSAPSTPQEAYCTICMEPKRKFECFPLIGCSHMFCSSCISLYVASKVEENVTSIRCPDPGCKDGFLEAEMCHPILPPDVFDRWCNALCESLIGEMKFYCPHKDCSALLIDERGGTHEVIKESKCPHCRRLFCAQCRVPWHVGLTCEGYQKLGEDERGQEDVMLMHLARNCKWQRCPKCKYYVDRIAGCMFMKCRCGYCFCYGCASPMTNSHYCSKCKR